MRPYLPSMLAGGYKMAQPARFPGSADGQITLVLATKRGVTCRLTGQGQEWETALK